MKCLVKIDANVIKHLNGRLLKLGIIFTSLGFALTLIYVLSFSVFNILKYNMWTVTACVLTLAIGILEIYVYYKAKSNSTKGDIANEIEFFDSYLESRSVKNGEVFQSVKIKYNEILKVKETSEYLFMYNSSIAAHVIEKNQFSEQELLGIKALIYKHNPKKGK